MTTDSAATLAAHEVKKITELSLIGFGRTAEAYSWGKDQVLKLHWPEMPREWIVHGARVGRTAAEAGLPVPSCG